MTTKNSFKNFFLTLCVSTNLINCSTTNSSDQSTEFATQNQNAQNYSETTEKLTEQFQSNKQSAQPTKSAAPLPANTPPPQDANSLPPYGNWLARSTGKTIRVHTTLENGANQNFPIVIDLVFVKKSETYKFLTTTNTKDWFRIDNMDTANLKQNKTLTEVHEITIIPDREQDTYVVNAPAHTIAGLFYARLIGSDNLYPILFNPYADLYLEFNFNRFTLRQGN